MNCIYPGIKERNSDIVMCSDSQDCYSKFNDLFDPFIKDIHGHYPHHTKVKSEMNFDNMRDLD